MRSDRFDVAVVGAGLTGAVAAQELSARGRSVLVLEQYAVGHEHGSSLDRVPTGGGSVVIASPWSGHGAKFAPLLGVLVADLVEGAPPDPRFAFRTTGIARAPDA